jgi:hypothetical protein
MKAELSALCFVRHKSNLYPKRDVNSNALRYFDNQLSDILITSSSDSVASQEVIGKFRQAKRLIG